MLAYALLWFLVLVFINLGHNLAYVLLWFLVLVFINLGHKSHNARTFLTQELVDTARSLIFTINTTSAPNKLSNICCKGVEKLVFCVHKEKNNSKTRAGRVAWIVIYDL